MIALQGSTHLQDPHWSLVEMSLLRVLYPRFTPMIHQPASCTQTSGRDGRISSICLATRSEDRTASGYRLWVHFFRIGIGDACA